MLGLSLAMFVPNLPLLFDWRGLCAPHAIGQDLSKIFAAFLAFSEGQHRPEIGFICILRNTVTAPVKESQLV